MRRLPLRYLVLDPHVGTGRVLSRTVTLQPLPPAFAGEVPYTVLLVALDDAPGGLCRGNSAVAAPDVPRADFAVGARP